MKENVLDVLMYLFENYIYDEPDDTPDRDSLESTLLEAGFSAGEINKAFSWLDALAHQRHLPQMSGGLEKPVRVFSETELQRMDTASQGFVMYLENVGVLDPDCRELVLDRLLALEAEEVTIEDVKWVILMVLFNQPGQEANYAWMEDLLFDSAAEYRH
jgi:Smg protein